MAIVIKAEKDRYFKSHDSALEFGIFKEYQEGSTKPLVLIHHVDADGIFSAQIVIKAIKEFIGNTKISITCVPYNYERQFDFSSYIKKGSNVIVVDLSLKMNDIKAILKNANSAFIIDHHLTTLREIDSNYKFYKNKIYDRSLGMHICVKNAGVRLCYNIFKDCVNSYGATFADSVNEKAIGLIDRYDRFGFLSVKDREDCLSIYNFTLRSNQLYINSNMVTELLCNRDYLDKALKFGKEFYDESVIVNEIRYRAFAKPTTFSFNGNVYSCCYMHGSGNSAVFGNHINDFDFVSLIRKNKDADGYTVSFYTAKENVDVSEIARSYGGGGHKKASCSPVKYNIYEEGK